MTTTALPRVYILSGPNGAGKTTFARQYLTHEASCPSFINADLIAAGLSPFEPERVAFRAGRIMLDLVKEAVRRHESFAFETTLAGRNYARSIRLWRSTGYFVSLIFLSLPSADFAVARVAERVRQGGHGVPEATIRRRYDAGRHNLEHLYKPLVDAWLIYDSAGEQPVILESGVNR